jgi:DNA-binding GntR family transcriptional regulator
MIATVALPRGQVAYERIKSDIFDFRLLPGDRFSEPEIAERFGMSRTPVREALLRLEREGYVTVEQRSGWQVRPLDFKAFDEFYDVRLILESAAIRRVCELDPQPPLTSLRETWLAPRGQWITDPRMVSELDEAFHATLVAAAGNRQLSRMHGEIAERIRIIRRLDFLHPERIRTTYQEHAQILRHILRRQADSALLLLRSHIAASKAEVRKITLHMLYEARHAQAEPVTEARD